MIRLTPLTGHGRLLRAKGHVAFISDHDPDLVDALTSATDLFKTLAEYIVERSFEVTDLIVVAIEAEAAMLFGDITVIAGNGQRYSAARTSTWLEVDLAGEDLIVAQPGRTPPSLELDLEGGYVAAGGFVLTLAPSDDSADRLVEILRSSELENDRPTARPASQPEEAADAKAAETDTGAEAEASLPPRVCSPLAEDDISLISEDPGLFDPLADPSGFDLDRLGSEPSVAGPVPPPERPVADNDGGVGVDPGREAHEVEVSSAAELDQPAVPLPPPASMAATDMAATDVAAIRPDVPPPPTVRPPKPAGQTILPPPGPPAPDHDTASPPEALPDTSPESVNIRFDDGQSVEVIAGIYVGRHPRKTGLPDGYDAVTIRGEQVSRRHWQLVISQGRALVSDLGSAAGTRVERSGRPEMDITDGVEVSRGDRIRFADRWADVE